MFRFISGSTLAPWLIAMAIAPVARAGDWHLRNRNECSDCHTQHNSANDQPMRTDNNPTPAPMLLRRSTPLELCISCHDGSNPAAPDVIAPVGYISNPAAGMFANAGGYDVNAADSTSHHLNTPSPVVPPGGTQPIVLVCTTCHDPHGNENYRNLRPDPLNGGRSASVVVGQTNIANGSNPEQVYGESNIIYKSGISQWCINCHAAPPNGHHSVDVAIFPAKNAKYGAWVSTTLPRVPVDSPADNVIPSHDDAVTCLSCHKAHGSTHASSLIYADGLTVNSTCQECHNK